MKKIVFFISLFFLSFFSFAELKTTVLDSFINNDKDYSGNLFEFLNTESNKYEYEIALYRRYNPKYQEIVALDFDDKDDALFWYADIVLVYDDKEWFEDYRDFFSENKKVYDKTEIINGIVTETNCFKYVD